MRTITALFLVLTFAACGENETTTKASEIEETDATTEPKAEIAPLIQQIELAHNKALALEKEAVEFDIELYFGGTLRLDAKLTLTTDGTRGLIEKKDSTALAYSHDMVMVSEDYKNQKGARFSAYTWSYFFLFPYKLTDPGTKWSQFEQRSLQGNNFNTGVLEFMPNTGDAPDDWYVMYADSATNLIHAAAYIVTAGGTREEAEEDPHAIEYLNYQKVDGVPLATEWKFWAWRETEGLTEQLGEAKLSNFKFVSVDEAIFELGENSIVIE